MRSRGASCARASGSAGRPATRCCRGTRKRGMAGPRDASRAPRTHPNQTPPEQEAAILKVRKAFPTWGSKKILWKLDRERPSDDWPARSTVDEILRRAGVVTPRGKRPRRQP
ncbi:MAG: helix-turn-helix domain-containing protein, partial [Planctomycetota bacterium]